MRGYLGTPMLAARRVVPPMSTGAAAMQQRFKVRKVAVLGAGVMGAQIAAHLVNVRVP